ncbi:MAG: TRAP transporter TatT component family protein [Acidobacteriota bacterium]
MGNVNPPGPVSTANPLLRQVLAFVIFALAVGLGGCSVRQAAVRTLSSALVSGDANVFSTDDDPELIGQALPFALKTLEALIDLDPENAELLLTTCSSYTQYTYAYVELEAERLRPKSFRESRRVRERAVKLYLRARDYCLKALDVRRPGASAGLLRDSATTLASFDESDVSLLYWTAGSWGSAISNGRHRSELLIDLEVVRQVLGRTLELDEDYGRGVLHDAMVALAALPEAMGGSYEQAQIHYRRAVELNGDRRVGSHLNWAWLVMIGRQDRAGFEAALDKALSVRSSDEAEEDRLANAVNRDFARFLRDQADELFLDDLEDDDFEDVDFENMDDGSVQDPESAGNLDEDGKISEKNGDLRR